MFAERLLTNAKESCKVLVFPPMKTLVTLAAVIIFGWLAVVTFFGPELARAINGPEPVKAKVIRTR